MILKIIINYLIQVVSTIGIVLVSGKLIAILNGYFYKKMGQRSKVICYATGVIGTPLHELSHALMCVIFGHKVLNIKFFQINSSDGLLGYVEHTYNRKNWWQRVGNFFIGIAPVVIGFLLLFGLFYLCMPQLCSDIIKEVRDVQLIDNPGYAFKQFGNIFLRLLKGAMDWKWWLFIFLGSFIALHMTLSGADIKGAKSGLLLTLVSILVFNVIVGIVSEGLLIKITKFFLILGNFMVFFLCVFLIIATIQCLIAYLLSLSKR